MDLDILRQVVELAMDFAERQKVGKQMEYIAYYDVLTGLPNRTLLTTACARPSPRPVAPSNSSRSATSTLTASSPSMIAMGITWVMPSW